MAKSKVKSVEELRALRAALIERRMRTAHRLKGPGQAHRVEELAHLHHAIAALEAVLQDMADAAVDRRPPKHLAG